MSTHISSGADEVLSSAAETGPEDPLDSLLKQIVGGYFVLTDGQGSVSKWSEPAELLFGRPAQEILGQSFFERLVQSPLPSAAQAWRTFLESGDAPTARGKVDVMGMHAEGREFPIETVFVPVKLDEGFDFSLFLEDLGFELPLNLMLLRMRQQHPVVVRALRQALDDEVQPWEGWRTAGTLVVFRPTQPTPWVEEELAAREAARAEADAEVEEAITNPDPGVQGSTVRDLDDAAAVVARLLSALERIDDLERMAAALPAQVQEARRDAEASRSRADAAEREATRLRADLERAVSEIKTGSNDTQHLELLARMERLERARLDEDAARASALKAAEASRAELAQRLERAEADRARAAEAIEGRVADAVSEAQRRAEEALAEARSRADSARSSFESRILQLEKLRSGDAENQQADLVSQLEQVRAEHEEAVQSARHELAEALERIERDREREAETARAELKAALERIEHVQRESDALREQLTQVTVERHEAEGLAGDERRRLADLQRDAEATRARIDALQSELSAEREQVAALKEQGTGAPTEDVEQLRAEQAEILRAQEALAAKLATLHESAAGTGDADAVEALAAELRRSQQEITTAQEQLVARAGEVEAVIAAQKDLGAEFTERYEDIQRAQAEFAARHEDIQRAQEQLDERSADILRSQDDFAQRHDEVRQAQAEMSRRHDELVDTIESLRAATSSTDEARAAAEREQAELREFVAASRRERDEFRASTEHALAQLAEVRSALREHESSISVQIPSNAVEHEELTAAAAELRGEIGEAMASARGEIAALRAAETALSAKLEALAGAGQAVGARLETLSARVEGVDALTARVEQLDAASAHIDGLAAAVAASEADKAGFIARLDEARTSGEALASRLDEVAGASRTETAKALAAAEAAALAAREAAAAGEAVAARVDEVAGARDELAALREEAQGAHQAAREIAARVDEIDRGAGSVLTDVRSVRERVEEVAALARAAQDAGATGVDELRTAVARLSGELQVARGELERAGEEALGAREQAATAQEAATAAREDAGRVREEAAAMRREVESGRDRATVLGASVEKLGESLAHTAQAAESAQTEATAARRSGKELARLVSELDQRASTLRTEMGAGRERLQAIDASVGKLGSVAEAAGADASAALAQADLLRLELADVRALAEKAAAGIDSMRADMDSVKAAADKMAAGADANRATVKAGEERLEAMGAEVTFALKSLDEIKAGLTSAGQAAVMARREAEQAKKAAQTAGEGSKDNVTEVFAQLLGLAAKKGNSGIHRRPSNPATKKPGPVKREPRHGFDDASQPMATLGLDGKFRELNPAFVKLVGYQEHEFAKATWPSPHDRAVYQQQQEQLSQLASGEIESVIVQSTYMHGQGLMVPVIGALKAVPGEDGLPMHLLLEAEDRHSH